MQDMLAYERLRAERSKLPLTYVRYVIKKQAIQPDFLTALEYFLGARLRATDSFGLINNQTLGIILPYTKASTVEVLANEIQRWISACGYFCSMHLHQYPASDFDPTNRQSDTEPWDDDSADDNYVFPSGEPWIQEKVPLLKHLIDILASAFALLLFIPLFVLIAIAIKVTSQGPVFFVQERIGRGGKPFNLYKFRTMIVGAEQLRDSLLQFNEQDGPAFKMKHDPRVTWVGHFLRRTSLDELPQLLNVLRRDMSLVGPRPLPTCEARACTTWQQRRHDVLPGITGDWQVSGRSSVTFDEWMRMDLHYIDHQTFLEDVRLLGKTIPAVFSCRGAG